ncbi:hypothetical protein LCGC14_0194310 [marine sediment metagenome]|uniref:Uncharacterized protein n=1 Tax=marine sediment metagenome TaxID=412755 RepID=A0A0F9UPM9_9ZZZZ
MCIANVDITKALIYFHSSWAIALIIQYLYFGFALGTLNLILGWFPIYLIGLLVIFATYSAVEPEVEKTIPNI